jgi:hypothetical protein
MCTHGQSCPLYGQWPETALRAASKFAAHCALSCVAVALFVLVTRAALLPLWPIPKRALGQPSRRREHAGKIENQFPTKLILAVSLTDFPVESVTVSRNM